MSTKMRIKKGDTIKVISGDYKGTQGVVKATVPKLRAVLIEDLNIKKRHIKPNKVNPRGGTKDVHVPFDVSKVTLVKAAKTPAKTKAKGGKK